MSVKEAAFRLKKSADTIYRWLRGGRLQGWQMGGSGCAILISEESVTGQLLCSLGSRRDFRSHHDDWPSSQSIAEVVRARAAV